MLPGVAARALVSSSHKEPLVGKGIKVEGVRLLCLPPYTLRLLLHSTSLGGASCRLRPGLDLSEKVSPN